MFERDYMKYIQSFICFIVLLGSLATALVSSAQEETLTNASIIELQSLNLGDAVIIEKIKTSKCDFDTSISGLKDLKAANVSGAVIEAMLATKTPAADVPASVAMNDPNDPKSPHDAGIYYYEEVDGKPKLTELDPSIYTGGRSSVAIFAEYGQSAKSKAQLNSAHAILQSTNNKPVFYFYFESTKSGLGIERGIATSPNEFVLAQFDCNEKKNFRTLVVGQFNAYAGSQTGPEDRAVKSFDFEKLSPGIYKVSPKQNLANGEYGFFYGGNSMSGKVYDFGIHGSYDETISGTNTTNNISDPEVAELCASLESDKPSDVEHALKVLRTMNAPEAVPKILPCLTNSNPNVIRDACRTLAVLGNKDVIPSIEPLLKHSRSDVRKDAQDAIDKLQAK
jgi:hypothetical protein